METTADITTKRKKISLLRKSKTNPRVNKIIGRIEVKQTTLKLLEKFQEMVFSSIDDLEEDMLEFWDMEKELFDFPRCIEMLKFDIQTLNSKLK